MTEVGETSAKHNTQETKWGKKPFKGVRLINGVEWSHRAR